MGYSVTTLLRIYCLSLLVNEFLKSVNIWRSYRQEVTNRPLIIILCKSILLQYLFFCVAADAYCHTMGILLWPLVHGQVTIIFVMSVTPLPSNRHHRSSGDCMEGKGENYQVCSVQYCVQQLCTVRCTHI